MLKKLSFITAAAAFAAIGVVAVSAQNFPTRSITMIIPFTAGGPTDVVGRLVGQRMGEILGSQIVIENVGGAGGMTGSLRVAQAPPDGYMMVMGTVGSHAQNQTLYKHPLYNAATDFAPLALVVEVPTVIIVRKDMPVNNLQEFIAYARPGQNGLRLGRHRDRLRISLAIDEGQWPWWPPFFGADSYSDARRRVLLLDSVRVSVSGPVQGSSPTCRRRRTGAPCPPAGPCCRSAAGRGGRRAARRGGRDPRRLRAQQLGCVGVLLLRHDRGARAPGVRELAEAELLLDHSTSSAPRRERCVAAVAAAAR